MLSIIPSRVSILYNTYPVNEIIPHKDMTTQTIQGNIHIPKYSQSVSSFIPRSSSIVVVDSSSNSPPWLGHGLGSLDCEVVALFRRSFISRYSIYNIHSHHRTYTSTREVFFFRNRASRPSSISCKIFKGERENPLVHWIAARYIYSFLFPLIYASRARDRERAKYNSSGARLSSGFSALYDGSLIAHFAFWKFRNCCYTVFLIYWCMCACSTEILSCLYRNSNCIHELCACRKKDVE